MSWSEVKKINSDLSKPLDELILGEKMFVGGTSALAILTNKRFIPKLNGVISVRVNGENNTSSSVRFKIYWSDALGNTLHSPEITVEPYTAGISYVSGYITVNFISACGQVTDYNYFDTEVIV